MVESAVIRPLSKERRFIVHPIMTLFTQFCNLIVSQRNDVIELFTKLKYYIYF